MPIDDALEKIQIKPGEEFKLVEEKEEVSEKSNQFRIIDCYGMLSRKQLEMLLEKLPIRFLTVDKCVHMQDVASVKKGSVLEVYHFAGVVDIYPPKGKRLYCASLVDMDFPIRPDNMMDDSLGLRCCFHPKLKSFGIDPKDFRTEIEISIYKKSSVDNKTDRYSL